MISDIPIKVIASCTDSPSFNVRVTHEGNTLFYNSTRLEGADRMHKLGKVLGITTLLVGTYDYQITQEQFNRICEIETEGR